MDDFFQSLLSKGSSTAKSLPEYQAIVESTGMIWRKPHEYNTAISGHKNFDDFFQVAHLRDAKLSKFTVEVFEKPDGSIEYLRGIQFFYKSPNGKTADGSLHRYPGVEQKGKIKAETFILDDDEYPIRMLGRTGLFVDQFGFRTTKGRELVFGGSGGGPRQLDAPKGFHFTRFGSVHCDGGIFSIMAESSIIPNDSDESLPEQKEAILDFNLLGNATYFASQRHSPAFLNRLAKRIIYSCNIQAREYIQQIMSSANKSVRSIQQIAELMRVTKNLIPNPFGDEEFNGLTITRNGGSGVIVVHSNTQNYRKSAFQTSFATGEILVQLKLADHFDSQFLSMLEGGDATIVGGCYMKNAGFAAKGYVTLIVRDDAAEKEIFKETISDDNLQKEWKQMFVKYQHEPNTTNSKLTATSVTLLVGGQDKVYWAGHYGNLISGLTICGVPFYSKTDRMLFTA